MREILFRGKQADNGEWVEGSLTSCGEYFSTITRIVPAEHIIYGYDVDPSTVGQYTGLTDKNGKRVFEGDIIRYADKLDYEMYKESLEAPEAYEGVDFSDLWTVDKVVYGIEWGYPAFDLCNHEFDCNGLSELSESMDYHYEVIGTIHDNPELLED